MRNLMETQPDTFMRAFPHLAGSLAFGADDEEPVFPSLVGAVTGLMDMDVSATGLKALQGRIWRDGYERGALKGHVFKDTVALLKWCQGELSPTPPVRAQGTATTSMVSPASNSAVQVTLAVTLIVTVTRYHSTSRYGGGREHFQLGVGQRAEAAVPAQQRGRPVPFALAPL